MDANELISNMKLKVIANAWKPFDGGNYHSIDQVLPFNKLYYISKGAREWVIDGKKFRSDNKSLVLIPAHTPVTYRNITQKIENAYFEFEATIDGQSVFDYISFPYVVPFSSAGEAEELFLRAQPPEGASDLQKTLHTYSCVVRALSEFLIKGSAVIISSPREVSRQLAKVIAHMNRYYFLNLDLRTLADLINVHPSYLSRIFKAQFGISPIKYANEIKLSKIKELLENSSCSINSISDTFNFGSREAFSRFVKQRLGMSPSHYREMYKKNNTP